MKCLNLRDRKGITAVIAIILLLMMTVAAAGGAYVWMQNLQEQYEGQAERIATRDISIQSLRCFNEEGTGVVRVLLKNSGETNINLNPSDVLVREFSSQNEPVGASQRDISLSVENPAGPVNITDNQGFPEPGGSAVYNIDLRDSLTEGRRYNVEFVFTSEDGITRDSSCTA